MEELLTIDRPNIKQITIKAYTVALTKIHTYIKTTLDITNLKWLLKRTKIMSFLATLEKLTTRKNHITAILVALKTVKSDKYKEEVEHYTNLMTEVSKEYNEFLKKQTLTPQQDKNWTTMEALKEATNKLGSKAKMVLLNSNKSSKDMFIYQDYVVATLYTELPPLRLDYADMVVVEEADYLDLEDDRNYLVVYNRQNPNKDDQYEFILNKYKTSTTYGKKILPVPKKVETIITKWLKLNQSGYFLINNKNLPLSHNSLSKLINKVFTSTGKKVGASLIRHIYLSDRYDANQEQMITDANDLLHSVAVQQNVYVKHKPSRKD
jgi:RNase H-fold protein (predicted Holliday junction resolvase)